MTRLVSVSIILLFAQPLLANERHDQITADCINGLTSAYALPFEKDREKIDKQKAELIQSITPFCRCIADETLKSLVHEPDLSPSLRANKVMVSALSSNTCELPDYVRPGASPGTSLK